MSRHDGGTAQKLQVGGKRFVLLPEREYLRLVRDTQKAGTDAIEFARLSIGRDLRHKRKKVGLTQPQVAAKAGIRLETLSRLENGRGNPTVATVKRILQALGEKA